MALCYTHTYMGASYVAMKMALWAEYKEVCVYVCVRGDHSILHSHYGIHYHLNDARVEANICWLTVAWEVSSLYPVHVSHHAHWGFAVLLAHTCSDKQAATASAVGGNCR